MGVMLVMLEIYVLFEFYRCGWSLFVFDVVIELGGTVSFVDCFRRDISTVMFTTLFGGDIPEKDGGEH